MCQLTGQLNWGVTRTRGLPSGDPVAVELRYSFLGSQVCFKRAHGMFSANGLFTSSACILTLHSWDPRTRQPTFPHHTPGAKKKPRANEAMRRPSAQRQVGRWPTRGRAMLLNLQLVITATKKESLCQKKRPACSSLSQSVQSAKWQNWFLLFSSHGGT